MGKPQRDLALGLVVFAGWFLANVVFSNVARDLGWLPLWLALAWAVLAVVVGVGGLHLFVRRWRGQFADKSSPPPA